MTILKIYLDKLKMNEQEKIIDLYINFLKQGIDHIFTIFNFDAFAAYNDSVSDTVDSQKLELFN